MNDVPVIDDVGARFEDKLKIGRVAENEIVAWLRSRGNGVVTVYEIEHKSGLGPRFFGKDRAFIAPDILLFNGGGRVLWCETKHKTVFSWYRIDGCWETGIDSRHYDEYLKVADETGLPVWLVFLHRTSTPSADDLKHNCPLSCPVGLFGGDLDYLKNNISHRSDKYGPHSMVYWAHKTLRKLADLKDVQRDAA